MKIELANGYFIEVDALNYTLRQKYQGKDKDGQPKESEKTIGYYGNLEDAVHSFLKANQLDSMADMSMDFDTYLEMVRHANLCAVQAIKKLWEGGGINEKL